MLLDTDVLIWHLRGNSQANHLIGSDEAKTLSAVSYMEIVQGLRSKDEARRWKAFLNGLDIEVLPIEENISAKAMFWF